MTKKTKPTTEQAIFDAALMDSRARISNSNRRLRVIDDLLRNTLETTSDQAAIVRLTSALKETEGIRANLSALDAAITENNELYIAATTPESREDVRDYRKP